MYNHVKLFVELRSRKQPLEVTLANRCVEATGQGTIALAITLTSGQQNE